MRALRTTPYQTLFEEDNLPENDDEAIDPEGIYVDSPAIESDEKILGLVVQLPHDGEQIQGIVQNRKRNAEGMLNGTVGDGLVLDTREYEVDFSDGSFEAYSTNIFLENI